jgi:FkbM family methyltransferase
MVLGRVRRLANVADAARRARVVDTSLRFAVNQSRRSPGVHTYGIRGSGLRIALRHGTTDIAAFNEVFVNGDYLVPTGLVRVVSEPRAPRVLDLGANIGSFALWTLARNRASRVVSIEPDPGNASIIRLAQRLNPDADWKLIEAAATVKDGVVQFAAGHGTASHLAGNRDDRAIVVRAVDAFPLLDDCDIAKIDIEGGEWPILSDPRLAGCRLRVLVVEYHSRDGFDGATAVALLQRAGFTTHVPTAKSSAKGLLWAYRSCRGAVIGG